VTREGGRTYLVELSLTIRTSRIVRSYEPEFLLLQSYEFLPILVVDILSRGVKIRRLKVKETSESIVSGRQGIRRIERRSVCLESGRFNSLESELFRLSLAPSRKF
jgi:hypothetical protein